MAKKIRTSLIRCDTHSMWYAPLMTEHDPLLLQRPTKFCRGEASHSWQSGGVHQFFYTNYGDPTDMTVPYVGGFEVVKIWDKERHVAEQAQAVLLGVPEICDSVEQCSDDVDLVFIGDCNLDGLDHLELAMPGLEKGVPTFVDKPFAYTVSECRQMVDTAKARNIPIFSASILRFEPACAMFRNRLSEVGDIHYAAITGAGTDPNGLVHSISLIQHVLGAGISTVQVMKTPKQVAIWLDYDNNPTAPRDGVMIHAKTIGQRPHTRGIAASVFGSRDDIHTFIFGGCAYPWGTVEIIKQIKTMLETNKNPPELDDMIEAIAVLEAFRESEQSGKTAQVANFL
jgi:hypothetical protein